MKHRLFARELVLSCATLMFVTCASATEKGANVQKTAQHYVTDFRRGVAFNNNDSVAGIVVNGRIVRSHLAVLEKELSTGTPDVRKNIVKLLEKIGLELDPPSHGKFQIIRDAAVIRALVIQGFAKDDSAASAAAGVLRKKCRPADLAAFNGIYTSSIQKGNGEFLYIAAKAKALQALPYVERMAQSPLWQEIEEDLRVVKIAQAALGNVAVEDEFIQNVLDAAENPPPAPKNRFYNVGDAKDGGEVAARMAVLGLIGTTKSLLTACGFLRSPLKAYVKNVYERSIRFDALDAIRYNFPDERVLYKPTQVHEWAAAEQFCIEKLGATFDGPTPSLPFDLPYPHHSKPVSVVSPAPSR